MILIFVSSLNENMNLANTLQRQLKEIDLESQIINLVRENIPMYNSELEESDGVPSQVLELVKKMENASGYLFVCPEYNFSMSPTHVNFVTWVSREGSDFRRLFTMKKIQLASHSGGGGMGVINTMRSQFTKLGALVLPREIIATFQSPLNEDSSKRILEQFASLIK